MNTQYIQLLKEFVAHKSISTDSAFSQDMIETAEWLRSKFEDNTFQAEIIDGYGNPIVLAKYMNNPDEDTCLIYGHYDVQPASEDDGWGHDPFALREEDDRLYARGVVDNKGQLMIHIATAFELIQKDALGYNLIFLIEGNEETGSAQLPAFLKDYKDTLDADLMLISDGEVTADHPTIEAGFRGVVNADITLSTASSDMHSGLYGGAVPNAAHELVLLLSKLFDEEYNINAKDIYNTAPDIDESITDKHDKIPFSASAVKERTGIQKLLLSEYGFYTEVSCKPTLQITGIESGYTDEGFRNSIPNQATAKINIRTAPEQSPKEVADIITRFINENSPDYTDVTASAEQSSPGVMLDTSNQYTKRAKRILSDVFEKEVFEIHGGGTLPIVAQIQEILDTPQVLVPLANEDCNMHAVNENYRTDLIEKGLSFSRTFLSG